MAQTYSPFTRIADHFRQAIGSGELAPGEKLPSQRQISSQFGVSGQTANNAVAALLVEGLVRTSPRGTFVADDGPAVPTARDRLDQVARARSILMAGETAVVTAASLVVPPLYVADLFGLDHGDQLVRREFVTGRGQRRTMLQVTWHPAEFAALVPDLLNTAPGRAGGILAKILTATGRTITHARDDFEGRGASPREANHLGVATGSPVLAGVHRWADPDGLIEYGEWVLQPKRSIGFTYHPPAIPSVRAVG